MTTLQEAVPATPGATRSEEHQAHDNYVLATRVVHRAETLLTSAEGYPEALAHIEAAFTVALSITTASTWAEVRGAREHLDLAQRQLAHAGFGLR
jgi:hypothetical protein